MHDPSPDLRTRFESLGLYLPEEVVTTRSLVDNLAIKTPFDLVKFTGIETRRRRGADEDTLSMSLEAARDCLSRSKYRAEDLDIIINGTISRLKGQTEYEYEPAMSLRIKHGLGATNAMNFDISNACAGMFTGVHILDSLIKAGTVRRGMVICGECNSPIFETAVREIDSPHDDQFASLTVGDAATAVILDGEGSSSDCIEFVEMLSCTDSAYLCLGKPSEKSTGVALYTQNSKLHADDNLRLWPHLVQRILDARGLSFADLGFTHLVPHQLGTRFTEKVAKVSAEMLGVELPPPVHVMDRLGNTASTSHFVALYLALREGLVAPGDKLLFQPAASGVVTGAISVIISDLGLAE
jgi:3-oxoacyl-[acyl-carrier-protein] synthase-3